MTGPVSQARRIVDEHSDLRPASAGRLQEALGRVVVRHGWAGDRSRPALAGSIVGVLVALFLVAVPSAILAAVRSEREGASSDPFLADAGPPVWFDTFLWFFIAVALLVLARSALAVVRGLVLVAAGTRMIRAGRPYAGEPLTAHEDKRIAAAEERLAASLAPPAVPAGRSRRGRTGFGPDPAVGASSVAGWSWFMGGGDAGGGHGHHGGHDGGGGGWGGWGGGDPGGGSSGGGGDGGGGGGGC
ncbi:hypothetical protein [Nocardioides litoris]|uniref:hypothetical protein n=1 Tax=Nocardioides litoris TaxID=1926648 RepID=UPI00111D2DCD|nr:hypothetical protein [Nocardioides litoris]